jgi:hypothetical protein
MPNGNLTITLDERELRELNRRLSELSKTEQRTAIAKALRNGISAIMRQGKINLAATDLKTGKKGNLKNSFAIKLDRKRSISYAGFKRPKGAVAHLVDRGTKARYTKKGYYRGTVQKRGPNTGSQFWTDAVESKGIEAVNTLMDTIYNEVARIMNGR